ncbi:hypothetical protein CVD06_09925 [Acinetobacter seifertii]|uniref:hypothetical protein n=2 Tax=Acinetobacter seifertii TaxID=1530123 RepID=UPI000C1E4F16|nr:hypothetical protein [Acinetobacter seifertii]PJF03911.1 hypothetical protein CVD06_09925 [Acinetobacter seifertii]
MTDDDSKNNELDDSLKKRINELSDNLKKLIEEIKNKRVEFQISFEKEIASPRIINRILSYLSEIDTYISGLTDKRNKILNPLEQLIRENLLKIKGDMNFDSFNSSMYNLYRQIELINIIIEIEREKGYFLIVNEKNNSIIEDFRAREHQFNQKFNEVNLLLGKTKNKKIHEYYEQAAIINQNRANLNKGTFIVIILLSLFLMWLFIVKRVYFGLADDKDYYIFKGGLILTSITLITYFLKQSVKYQKVADQCKQTQLELEAFPDYVSNLSNEDPLVADLRKQLALKYFGRDVDNKSNDETSNLLQDQMKNTTEMVKAAMEVIKKSGNQGG